MDTDGSLCISKSSYFYLYYQSYMEEMSLLWQTPKIVGINPLMPTISEIIRISFQFAKS
jgi:hypothetical protein